MLTVVHTLKGRFRFTVCDKPMTPKERAYALGDLPPRYLVPALMTDMLYWRMPSFPTKNLIAGWFLWRQGS